MPFLFLQLSSAPHANAMPTGKNFARCLNAVPKFRVPIAKANVPTKNKNNTPSNFGLPLIIFLARITA